MINTKFPYPVFYFDNSYFSIKVLDFFPEQRKTRASLSYLYIYPSVSILAAIVLVCICN